MKNITLSIIDIALISNIEDTKNNSINNSINTMFKKILSEKCEHKSAQNKRH